MHQIELSEIGTDKAWRDHARSFIAQKVPPEALLWSRGAADVSDLFSNATKPEAAPPLSVPRNFVALANHVVWHSDSERFAYLYVLLWRLQSNPALMSDRADATVSRLHAMAKEVRRDKHKMTAFLRFREVDNANGKRRFAAWFEPSHFIMEPSAPFFARRFGDMDWFIATPHLCAKFEDGRVSFEEGQTKPALPVDATEDLWRTYFRNIFNPARLKVQAMQSEMPKKYWRNLPEAELIPELIATAQSRANEMARAAPTLPPVRAARIKASQAPRVEEPYDVWSHLQAGVEGCARCPLHATATQAVPGEGPLDAKLMVVGEQPGDQEDLAGRPFVGPAGQMFDHIAQNAGLDRSKVFVTNAVKHFKFTPRGRRRIHQRPDVGEVQHCKWWLKQEIDLVKPDLILALGATAARALTGRSGKMQDRRGTFETGINGVPVLISFHPSYILRADSTAREAAKADLKGDVGAAIAFLKQASLGGRIETLGVHD